MRIHSKRVGVALGMLWLAATACHHLPQPGDRTVPPISFNMFPYILPSGLRVVLQEDHSSPQVAVVTVVSVGSADDPEGKEGLAHLVEHLTFAARPQGGARMWNRLEQVAQFNAATEWDTTTYTEVGPRESVQKMLELASQRLVDPLAGVDEKAVVAERSILGNEELESDEHGELAAMRRVLFDALFPKGHPYARAPQSENLRNLEWTDAIRFAKQSTARNEPPSTWPATWIRRL